MLSTNSGAFSEISLYIHFPWCEKKCPYCDFNSHGLTTELPEAAYIDTLIKQLYQDLSHFDQRQVKSIFLGGGTPSLFSAPALARLFETLKQNLDFAPNLEITLEANPGSVEIERFKSYFDIGINRISVGVQSFQDSHLKTLGRIHDSKEAAYALETLHRIGFENFNIDLMYGLPNQTLPEALEDLKTALAFSPAHLSWYQLTLEPNTYFYRHPPPLPVDDMIATLEESGRALLLESGFKRYEISAYTPNKPCRHNLNYWEFGDYFPLGAGAHGKITCPKTQEITRIMNYKQPRQYMNADLGFHQHKTQVLQTELPFEYMLNVLRLTEGTPIAAFAERTFISPATLFPALKQALQKNLIYPFETQLKPTPLGLQFLNDLTLLFMSEHESPEAAHAY